MHVAARPWDPARILSNRKSNYSANEVDNTIKPFETPVFAYNMQMLLPPTDANHLSSSLKVFQRRSSLLIEIKKSLKENRKTYTRYS